MKTTVEYEAADIRDEDPLHGALKIAILLALIIVSDARKKAEAEGQEKAATHALNEAVAGLINALDKAGYVLTAKEAVPAAFRG